MNDPRWAGVDRYERVELESMAFDSRYKILSGAVIPRPIALVSTLAADGSVNIAPFSSFMIASVENGYLAFSVGPSEHPKRTLLNIRRSRMYVINAVSEGMADAVQRSGAERPAKQADAPRFGFALLPSECIAVPRVADARIHFECRLRRVLRFGESNMVIGEVVRMHVRAGLMSEGKIDPARYAPLGRLAGRNYCTVRDVVRA